MQAVLSPSEGRRDRAPKSRSPSLLDGDAKDAILECEELLVFDPNGILKGGLVPMRASDQCVPVCVRLCA